MSRCVEPWVAVTLGAVGVVIIVAVDDATDDDDRSTAVRRRWMLRTMLLIATVSTVMREANHSKNFCMLLNSGASSTISVTRSSASSMKSCDEVVVDMIC